MKMILVRKKSFFTPYGADPYASKMGGLQIVLIASEIEPFAKTGGLADMLGSFSHALVKLGYLPRLMLPKYRCIPAKFFTGDSSRLDITVAGRNWPLRILAGQNPSGAPIDFFDIPELFDRPGIYGEKHGDYPDNCLRYTVFCRAVLEWLRRSGSAVDILHSHDWQSALIPVYLKTLYAADPAFAKSRGLLTLHNMAYQGNFPATDFPLLDLEKKYFRPNFLEFFQKISLLKGGIVAADSITTVSPSYAREVLAPELGFGMEGILHKRQDRFSGILNGIDEEEWNPETNPELPFHFSAHSLDGKARCKSELQEKLGLPLRPDIPLFGTISRLVHQKGIDLLLEAIPTLAQRDFQWAILGQGEEALERALRQLAERFPEKVAARIGYDVGLSQRLTAGADFLAMPSRFEPCGYNQLYALRYGTIPLVHGIGGLRDSVRDWREEPERGTGIVMQESGVEALRNGWLQALEIFRQKEVLAAMRQRGMAEDFTWKYSARQYLALYEETLRNPKTALEA